MKKQILFLTIALVTATFWYKKTNLRINGVMPAPTEFNIKKSKRKDFKNERKEFLKNMHRSDSNTDWEMLNTETRAKRTKLVQAKRSSLISKGLWNPNKKYIDKSINANIQYEMWSFPEDSSFSRLYFKNNILIKIEK